MNIKECLLLVLIPLGVLPVCLCLIIFSLFPFQNLAVPVGLSIVIVLVSVLVAIGISTFFQDIFQEIGGAIHRLGRDELETEININSTLRDANRLGVAMEQMRHKLLKHRELEIKENTLLVREQMAARVAHDMRSPLSSLQASVRLLRMHVASNADSVEAMNLLQLSSQRLENIANDLLLHHGGKSESGRQLFSIHEVLDELLGELQATPIAEGVTVKKNYNSAALYVHGDKNGITRAIGNVIKNAFEAMQKNPIERPRQLTVSTMTSPSPQSPPIKGGEAGEIALKITDTGPGIPAEKIPLILQGGHTEGKSDGHGIGTKVLYDVVKIHNGQVTIESEVGKGTLFTITFPRPHTIPDDTSQMTVTLPYIGTGTICVIDDEPSLREQWRITLKGLGVTAETRPSWEDAEPVLPSDMQTTFIVDYHFDNSEIDGLEIIRRLKEKGYANLVLATAEYWKPVIKEATKELNITLCPKPLPKVVLQPCHPEPQAKDLDSSVAALPQNDKSGPSVLLIDDDEAVRMSWKAIKKILGVTKLTMYSNLEEMIAAATNPADYDMCVIDKNIKGSQYNGAKMLAHLKENGAKKVFLATGESRRLIEQDPAFASIDGIITEKIPMSLEKYLP